MNLIIGKKCLSLSPGQYQIPSPMKQRTYYGWIAAGKSGSPSLAVAVSTLACHHADPRDPPS